MINVLALSGSSRRGSLNTALLTATQRLAVDLPVAVAVRQSPVTVADIPPFDADSAELGLPRTVGVLERAVAAADALLLATPEYSGAIPGPLKNVLDWLACPQSMRPLASKPVAVMSASPSRFGAQTARSQVLDVLQHCDACLVAAPVVSVALADRVITRAGDLNAEHSQSAIRVLLTELAHTAKAMARSQRVPAT